MSEDLTTVMAGLACGIEWTLLALLGFTRTWREHTESLYQQRSWNLEQLALRCQRSTRSNILMPSKSPVRWDVVNAPGELLQDSERQYHNALEQIR